MNNLKIYTADINDLFNVVKNEGKIGKESFNAILQIVNDIKKYNIDRLVNNDLENAYFLEDNLNREDKIFFDKVKKLTPQLKLELASYFYTSNTDYLKNFNLVVGFDPYYIIENINENWFIKVFITLYLI